MEKFIQIRVYFKNELLRESVFKPNQVVLGRGSDCQLVLDNAGISRHHAEVRVDEGGQLILRDLQSGNGTFVNGKQVEEVEVTADDNLAIGKFTLKVSLTEARPDSANTDDDNIAADDINQTVCLRPDERQQIITGAATKNAASVVTAPSRDAPGTTADTALSPWFMFTAGLLTGFAICGIIALF